MSGVLVCCLGNPDRGDDGVGGLVAARLNGVVAAEVRCLADAAALLDAFAGRSRVVIVDCMVGELPPGSVCRFDAAAGPLSAWRASPASSHLLQVPLAIELARALGALPPRCVVVAVAGSCFAPGSPPQPAVAAAVDAAVALIEQEIACTTPS